MAYQPLPFAKRQKIGDTFAPPNLDPSAPRQPRFHQPFSAPSASSSASTTASARPHHHRHHHPSGTKPKVKAERGNYQGYYHKRRTDPTARDPRLALIPREWFIGARVLDVGCNCGVVTIEIAQSLQPDKVIGVDIDEELVKSAIKQVDLAWSRQAPIKTISEVASRTHDLPPHQQETRPPSAVSPLPPPPPTPNYFPLAFPRLLGYLPHPARHLVTRYQPTGTNGTGMPKPVVSFPKNVQFETADWATTKIDADAKGYHLIIAFSVTKWIHLHGLNEGLKAFFARVFECLLPGGRFILEPQPFSSYSKSARGSTVLKVNHAVLKDDGWRAENGDFTKVLLDEIGFESAETLGETGEKGFKRPITAYTKRKGDWV